MKAVVFHGPRQVAVEEVTDPKIEEPLDAIIKITTTNINKDDPSDWPYWAERVRAIWQKAVESIVDTGRVVNKAEFATWIRTQRVKFAPVSKSLPPYSKTYFPDPQRRGG